MTTKAKDKDEAVHVALTRDEIRSQLLGTSHKPKCKLITIWGIEIELRQASLRDILKASGSDDVEVNAVNMVVRYAYMPGTNTRIFEDTDRNVILGWPFGEDMQKLQAAVAELTGISEATIEKAKEELKDNPLKG